MQPKKPIANELRELDVDRVDGVDRPATGRAFALFKSEITPDMVMIHTTLKQLFPSADDVRKKLYATAIDENVLKVVDKNDKPTGLYIVRGTDVSSQPMPFEDACALVKKAIDAALAEGRRKAGKPVDETLTHVNSGTSGDLADNTVNADPRLADEQKPKKMTTWERHTAKGAMIDGVRGETTKRSDRPRLL